MFVLLCSWSRIYWFSTKHHTKIACSNLASCDTLLSEKFWFPSLLRYSCLHSQSTYFFTFPWLKFFICKQVSLLESDVGMNVSGVFRSCLLTYSEARFWCEEVYSSGWSIHYLGFQHLCSSLAAWRREWLFGFPGFLTPFIRLYNGRQP